ncbi:MAG: DUF3500 domain-containing protein [Fimbriimonadaceae bacterium]
MNLLFLLAAAGYCASPSKQDFPYIAKAGAFLAGLDKNQLAKALLPFEDDARTAWAYTPGARAGITLKELAPVQRNRAMDLLQASLSESGYRKAEAIRADLEAHLRVIENNPGRDPEMYYFVFFGRPASNAKWAWRYEGHHLSLSFTFLDGNLIASTPQFMGSNPAEVLTGPRKGLRVLGEEEDLGRKLVKSLSQEQRRAAVLSDVAPAEIVTSNLRKAGMLEDKGVRMLNLSNSQATLLKSLVKVIADVQKPAQAKVRLAKIEKAGWNKVRFAWMGGTEPGQGHYYRIQGPTFLIEYDNTQNGANHIHTVWRDFEGDFGRDALLEHYQKAEHHRR